MRSRIALTVALCLCLTSCVRDGGVSESPHPSDTEITVVASFYPLYIAALNVIGDTPGVNLSLLASPDTGCLHDYLLRPQDMAALAHCDLFLLNGAGLESFLDHVLARYPELPLCIATTDVDLIPGDDVSEEVNPHAWVSVGLYTQYVRNIRDGLAVADPSRRDIYDYNAEGYIERLEALGAEMHDALDGLPRRDIVTFHEAFAYFANEFSLRVAAVIQREPGQDPSPTELAQTIDIVRRVGVTALFAEPQYSPSVAEVIARETGATVYMLDPAVTGTLTADAYERAMRGNMETLEEALS